MCFDFLYERLAKGVCLVKSLEDKNLPKKIKVSVVTHRFGCKFGLCTITDLVQFHFTKPRLTDFVSKEQYQRKREEQGHYCWTSQKACLNLDKLFKHKDKEAVRIAITWRRGFKPPPTYIPMKTFLG